MMPIITAPLALLGLLALPALIAIYFLRRKYRPQRVSSLVLWTEPRPPAEGGRYVERLQTPLAFLLELLALTMLVFAAAGPLVHSAENARPLVVVLDDSFSMQAGGKASPRNQAAAALLSELRREKRFSASFVLAGKEPQVLGEAAGSLNEVQSLLGGWKCNAPSSALEQAAVLALDMGAIRPRVLVLTDVPPDQPPQSGAVQWWSFGEPRANVAFVNAVRTQIDVSERCMLEVENFSTKSAEVEFTASLQGEEQPLEAKRLRLAAGGTQRLVFSLPEGAPALTARITADSLELDDEVVLLPTAREKLGVRLDVADEKLKSLVSRALEATERIQMSERAPKLSITDRAEPAEWAQGEWALVIIPEKDAQSYTGPFITNYNHPLAEGLSFEGVVWGAGKSKGLVGTPIVSAGDIVLLADMERLDGGHSIRMRFRPDLSTLQYTMNWPALIWNLVDWRVREEYGPSAPNVVTGDQVEIRVPPNAGEVSVTAPSGDGQQVAPSRGIATITAGERGVYEISAGGSSYRFAANTLNRSESNLASSGSGRWGGWNTDDREGWGYRSFAWFPLLIALAALGAHLLVTSRAGKGIRL